MHPNRARLRAVEPQHGFAERYRRRTLGYQLHATCRATVDLDGLSAGNGKCTFGRIEELTEQIRHDRAVGIGRQLQDLLGAAAREVYPQMLAVAHDTIPGGLREGDRHAIRALLNEDAP